MEIANLAVKRASELGATEAEAFVRNTRTIQVEYAEKIQNMKTVESTGLGLRFILGKRTALYSTSILDEEEVIGAAEKAGKMAKVAPEDPDWRHLNMGYERTPTGGFYDKALEGLDYDEIVSNILSAVELVEEHDERVKPTRGLLSLSTSTVSLANSYGETVERMGTSVSSWFNVKAEDAGLESTGSAYQQARSWGEVDLRTMALRATDQAVSLLKAKSIPGGEMPVIIRNQVFASILGVMLSDPVNAYMVQKGGSPLSGKLGQEIAADDVTVIDDGLMYGGWMTRTFDDEGHPTQRTPIFDGGVLRGFLYDTYTALKDDVESTGNARRSGYSSPPMPAPSNLILEKGTAGCDEIIQDTKRGIFVEEVIGEWLSNPVSGNLNATVTHGYTVKDGELAEPVKGVVLSVNFYDLLRDGFETIGDDTMNNGGIYSPTVKLRKLTIAGE